MSLKILQSTEERQGSQSIKNRIGIAAGKGGVGKSTVTVNLAFCLKDLGYSVGVMDTDLYGPSIRKMLGVERPPQQQGTRILPAIGKGIKYISMAFLKSDQEAAAMRAPIANQLIQQFIKQVDWGDLDYLLIDFPPGTGDIQLTLAQQAHLSGAIIVTTPQEVALLDVRKAMHLFKQVKIPIFGLVENMSYFPHPDTKEPIYLFGKGGGRRLAEEAAVPFLGEIPLDQELCRSGDESVSLFESKEHADNLAVSAFKLVTENLVSRGCNLDGTCLDSFELVWKEM